MPARSVSPRVPARLSLAARLSRSCRPLFARASLVVTLVLLAPAAAAESPATNSTELAQQRFREATEAYNEGRYSAAASLFDAADRLAPHPSTRYNAATAWEQAGEAARARSRTFRRSIPGSAERLPSTLD